jgi:periplasmic protein CpxP/Spy
MKTAFVKIAVAIAFTGLAPLVTAQAQGRARGENIPRDLLEQRLRERTGEVVRRRLELNDAQMKQLQNANRQFEQQRSALVMREREIRRALREEVLSGDKANQEKVAQLLDQTMQLQRQRLDLMQNEQRELAKFLTPVQRAKLIGLQNEMRRRAQELRARPGGRKGPPDGPRGFDR